MLDSCEGRNKKGHPTDRDAGGIFPPQRKKRKLHEVIEMLINAVVVTRRPYINVSNQHAVHLKLTRRYMPIRFQQK